MRGSMGPLDNDTLHVCGGDLALLCHSFCIISFLRFRLLMGQDPMRIDLQKMKVSFPIEVK